MAPSPHPGPNSNCPIYLPNWHDQSLPFPRRHGYGVGKSSNVHSHPNPLPAHSPPHGCANAKS
eukprot:scaffold85786_cov22-Tisochrysis_lutea.AAC.1